MREKIVIAPGINGNELINSISMHGINSINMRVCNAGELARLAFMRSGQHMAADYHTFLSDNKHDNEEVIKKIIGGLANTKDLC